MSEAKPRRKLVPLKAQTQYDVLDNSKTVTNEQFKKKTEDLTVLINFG